MKSARRIRVVPGIDFSPHEKFPALRTPGRPQGVEMSLKECPEVQIGVTGASFEQLLRKSSLVEGSKEPGSLTTVAEDKNGAPQGQVEKRRSEKGPRKAK